MNRYEVFWNEEVIQTWSAIVTAETEEEAKTIAREELETGVIFDRANFVDDYFIGRDDSNLAVEEVQDEESI